MAELHLYDVTINNFPTQLQLTEADAKALYPDAKRVGSVAPVEPTPVVSEPVAGEKAAAATKARTAQNKARPAEATKAD